MPVRSQTIIRRGINRLDALIKDNVSENLALSAISGLVSSAKDKVNNAWQNYQSTAVAGDKERQERNDAINELTDWVQQWRPVIFLVVPGAESNIHNLPAGAATPDDIIRVAEDMLKFIESNSSADTFKESAVTALGERLVIARKETADATAALPAEMSARENYGEACLEANGVLTRSLNIVRAVFGPTSPEYKQFIGRSSAKDEDEIDEESAVGES